MFSPDQILTITIGMKRTQTKEILIGKAGITSISQMRIPVKEGFRITTQLVYDKINNLYESKSVSQVVALMPLSLSVVQDTG